MATTIPGSTPSLSTRIHQDPTRSSDPAVESRATTALAEPRPARTKDDLALSIMKDGGLSLLQSELNRKMEDLFGAAEEQNPELAAAGPSAFFDTSVDVSPEATAERIVSFALSFNLTYRAQNPGQNDDAAAAGFEAEIRRGIEDGFRNAHGVLSSLDMLNGGVQTNVDRTYELVQEMLAEAFAQD